MIDNTGWPLIGMLSFSSLDGTLTRISLRFTGAFESSRTAANDTWDEMYMSPIDVVYPFRLSLFANVCLLFRMGAPAESIGAPI